MIETVIKEEEINGQKVTRTFTYIGNLKTDQANPKEISDEKHEDLCHFLEKYGQLQPLLVDARPEKEGTVLGGNSTLECLKEIGVENAWIEFRLPKSDAEAFEIATLHNAQFGNYIESKLTKELEKYQVDLQEELKRLTISTGDISLDGLLNPPAEKSKKPKFQILILCDSEENLQETYTKLAELNVKAKIKR